MRLLLAAFFAARTLRNAASNVTPLSSPSRITLASRASARRLHPAATVTLTPSRSATSN